jgi:hypothetical protein
MNWNEKVEGSGSSQMHGSTAAFPSQTEETYEKVMLGSPEPVPSRNLNMKTPGYKAAVLPTPTTLPMTEGETTEAKEQSRKHT